MSLTVTDILKFRESESDPWQRLLLQANINFNLIYPVGSIYMSTVNVDPATLFGGTWERLEDRFLLGAGSTYTAGDTGGSATMAHTHSTGNHTLTVAEMPSHSHKYTDYYNVSKGSGYKCVAFNLNADPTGLSVQATGGGGAHNHGNTGAASNADNMPPYIVVYMWKRLTLSPSLTPIPMNVLGDVASEDIVPVSKGGTGADNAADARANLGLGNVVWAARYALTLSSSAATIVDDRFTSNARVVITPEYDGVSPLNLCFTAQILDGGAGNRRLNVYVRTGAGGAVTGTVLVNVMCSYQ